MKNPLVVVAGCERTGTSLMMQCLHKSGYYIGEKNELGGGYFLCEYKEFNHLNRIIRDRGNVSSSDANKFIENLHVDAIKTYAPAVKFWLRYKIFRNAKYIRTIRNEHNVLDSLLARNKGMFRREAKAHYDEFMEYLKILDNHDNIFVKFEDMLSEPLKQGARIAEFLGIKSFSTKPINPDLWHFVPHETY